MTTLAIDPGMNSPGAALFRDHVLIAAMRIAVPEAFKALPEDGQRWLAVATQIHSWVSKWSGGTQQVTSLVYEKPQWYQRKDGGSKGDPNKLAGVLAVACNLAGRLSCQTSSLVVCTPEPARWIGQVSKECPTCEALRRKRKGTKVKTFAKDCPDCHGSAWETPRGRRIHSRLYPDELALVPDQNDAIDAVGLGLWFENRLVPQRVYSNS